MRKRSDRLNSYEKKGNEPARNESTSDLNIVTNSFRNTLAWNEPEID